MRETQLVISLSHDGHGVVAENSKLACVGYGKTTGEALSAFLEMFAHQREAVVECCVDDMTEGARCVRAAFLRLDPIPPMAPTS